MSFISYPPKKQKVTKEDIIIKKIKKMYLNYGISTDDMDEEELFQLCQQYLSKKRNIDEDLRKSEEHRDKFDENNLIG